ncbi:MAG: hypothetical protein LBK94_12330 [Prevotellaceae bacterium]|jgi:hypothetical protein|nr:hypothetical protein [Prevotellaceae bacterium]
MKTELNHQSEPIVDRSISEDYYNSDMYVKMAHVVTNRVYWSFTVMTIVCIMTLVVLFNHYWSYEEHLYKKMNVYLRLNDRQDKTNTANITKDTILFGNITQDELINKLNAGKILPIDSLGLIKEENIISEKIRESYIDNHIESSYIAIPILGIKVGVNDILIVMGITFLILSLWLFVCIRAENFTIGKILSLNQTKNINIRRYIFYGICFNNMFFPTTQRRKEYSALSNISKSLMDELKDIPGKAKRSKWRNSWVCLIFFIPVAIMAFNLCIHINDVSSLTSDNKNYKTIEYKAQKYYINDSKMARMDFKDVNVKTENDPYDKYLWWILGVSTCFVFSLFYFCKATYKYQIGTSKVLYHFKQRFKHDDDCMKGIERYKLKESKATIQVVSIDSKTIFSNKNKYNECKNEFKRKYSIENGFYLLTHSGYINEVDRLRSELSKKEEYNYENNPGVVHFGQETNKKEYFIFLKKTV